MATANISGPEVLKRFRHRFVKFDDECRQALGAVNGDVARIVEWLRREQLAHWKRQLRKREEMVQSFRLEYLSATQEDKYHRKSSGVDERKRLEKAKRMKTEAEDKIQLVKKWSMVIESKSGTLLRPCSSLSTTLEIKTPRALARLDKMLDSLDNYLRPGASTGTSASTAAAEDAGETEKCED